MRIEIFRVGGSVEICDEENQDHVVMKVIDNIHSTIPVRVTNESNERIEFCPCFDGSENGCLNVTHLNKDEDEQYPMNNLMKTVRNVLGISTPWHVTEVINEEAGQEVTNDFATFEYARYYAGTCYGETRIWHDDDLEEE